MSQELTGRSSISAALYENPEPSEGKGKFVAIHEIETDDIEELNRNLAEPMVELWAEGRISELIEVVSTSYLQTNQVSVKMRFPRSAHDGYSTSGG